MNEAAERDVIGARRDVTRFVDIGFPARGTTFPLDHGYALFAAVLSAAAPYADLALCLISP